MKVLVFETGFHGHRLTYVRRLIEALQPLDVEIHLAVPPAAANSDEFRHQLSHLLESARLVPGIRDHASSGVWSLMRKIKWLRAVITDTACEHVFVPHADGLVQAAALSWPHAMPGVELEGLLMRGTYAYPAGSVVARMRHAATVWSISKGPWTRLHHLDPRAVEVLKAKGIAPLRRLLMPDAVEAPVETSKSAARRRLGLPENMFLVCCAGALTRRKGVVEIATAIGRLQDHDVGLLLAGKQDDDLSAALHQGAPILTPARLFELNAYLADATLDDAIVASDVVCTLYRSHTGSASILIKAVQCQRPVLSSEGGWMARMVADFDLGWSVDPTSTEEIVAAIDRMRSVASTFRMSERAKQLRFYYSTRNQAAHWVARLRERLGMPSESQISFNDVGSDPKADTELT